MPLNVQIQIDDNATPKLAELNRRLKDRTELNSRIGSVAEVLTRRYILEVASPARHTTAERLGATPTGYLSRRGNAIESSADTNAAYVTFGGAAEIFSRVTGPVKVSAVGAKYLTIPAQAESYGKRAGEFSDLKFVPFASGARALVKQIVTFVTGKRGKPVKKIQSNVFYWLKASVILPQDRELLPNDQDYEAAAESMANDYIEEASA